MAMADVIKNTRRHAYLLLRKLQQQQLFEAVWWLKATQLHGRAAADPLLHLCPDR